MYSKFEDTLPDIQKNWKESWFKYLFHFTNLTQILNAPKAPNAIEFLTAYLNSWWITRYYFQYFIEPKLQKNFHTHISQFLEIKSILIAHDLYDQEKFVLILALKNNLEFIEGLRELANSKILNPQTYEALFNTFFSNETNLENESYPENSNEIAIAQELFTSAEFNDSDSEDEHSKVKPIREQLESIPEEESSLESLKSPENKYFSFFDNSS
ncbi:MAG: hypothetical protein QG556_513, partial [Pseudomonadota bacterium]|nr:hypothetical protein [Pseudomonadota bacterium]